MEKEVESNGYEIHLMPALPIAEVMDFTIVFLRRCEEETATLHVCEIEQVSIVAAKEITRRLKEHLLKPDVLLNLWSRALAEELDFEIDPTKGTEYFFEEVAKNSSSELLHAYLAVADYDPYRKAIENELKLRGEIENDRNY